MADTPKHVPPPSMSSRKTSKTPTPQIRMTTPVAKKQGKATRALSFASEAIKGSASRPDGKHLDEKNTNEIEEMNNEHQSERESSVRIKTPRPLTKGTLGQQFPSIDKAFMKGLSSMSKDPDDVKALAGTSITKFSNAVNKGLQLEPARPRFAASILTKTTDQESIKTRTNATNRTNKASFSKPSPDSIGCALSSAIPIEPSSDEEETETDSEHSPSIKGTMEGEYMKRGPSVPQSLPTEEIPNKIEILAKSSSNRPTDGYHYQQKVSLHDADTHAALKLFRQIITLAKRPGEWDGVDILLEDDYNFSNEASRQEALRYCHDSAIDVLQYLFHKIADAKDQKYQQGRREYQNITVGFTGSIDTQVSLGESSDIARKTVESQDTWLPHFDRLLPFNTEDLANGNKEMWELRKEICTDIISLAPHVLRTESWVLLFVMTILSKAALSKALIHRGIHVGASWYDDSLADLLKRFRQSHPDYTFLDLVQTFSALTDVVQREPAGDDDPYTSWSTLAKSDSIDLVNDWSENMDRAEDEGNFGSIDELSDEEPRTAEGFYARGSRGDKATLKKGTKRSSENEDEDSLSRKRKSVGGVSK